MENVTTEPPAPESAPPTPASPAPAVRRARRRRRRAPAATQTARLSRRTIAVFVASNAFALFLGIVTSWVFWRYMLYLKPDVRVSPVVLKGPSRSRPGVTLYRIKIANFGSRQVKDLSFLAAVYRLSGVPGVDQRRVPLKHLTLSIDSFAGLGPHENLHDYWGLSPILTFSFEEEIESLLTDDNARLIVTVSATDATSGTTIIQRRAYTRRQILPGDFKRDIGFGILPVSEVPLPPGAEPAAE